MTLDHDAAIIPIAEQDRPADPRPAWERVAYAWLEREVDAGQPVDPATLAGEVSVAPGLARDLLRVLRGQRDRDPDLSELRGRLIRDRIADTYLRRELAGGGGSTRPSWRPRSAPRRRWPASGWPACAPSTPAARGSRAWASRSATAAPRPANSPGCRPISPLAATSRRRSLAAPLIQSG